MPYLKNFILTLIGLITFIVQFSNNFFLETVKSEFSYLPGKEKLLKTIVRLVFYIMLTLEIPIMVYSIFNIRSNTNVEVGNLNWITNLINILGWIVIASFLYNCFFIPFIFLETRKRYIEKLQNNIKIKFNKYPKNGIKFGKGFSVISLAINLALTIFSMYVFLNTMAEKNNALFLITFGTLNILFNLSVFIILSKLQNIINELESNIQYRICLKSKEVICKSIFLEFDEYYLFINNNEQRFIPKGEVLEIYKKCGDEYKMEL